MSRAGKEELRARGLSLTARFSLLMGASLAVVMAIVGFFLLRTTRDIVDHSLESALRGAAHLDFESQGSEERIYEQTRDMAVTSEEGRLERFDVRFTSGQYSGQEGQLYRYSKKGEVLVPAKGTDESHQGLLGLMLAVTALVILVGTGVAFWVASRVSLPLETIVEDVRHISRGNLEHRTRVRGGGSEVMLLARSIDRMASSLSEAQEAELELSVREREREVAMEVREALLPAGTPSVPGCRIAALHVGCPEPGGDFHDFVEQAECVVTLVCDVSGNGVPGALVGATARAYLRAELERGCELADALRTVNKSLARDVRRGMYVTALAVVLDPASREASVGCAGHKIPLVRYSSADGRVHLLQPEGIALGFDPGPVFDSRLHIHRFPFDPGDRLVLANTAPVRVIDAKGREFGEKAFYRAVQQSAGGSPERMLKAIRRVLQEHAGDEPLPADISIVAIARDTGEEVAG